ncbi:helix-turn-helix domain-containing protein [Sphingomonas sp. LB-2]|uniref:helix-turn-helix domain-containing protein n=1 Tax=Sphingomonas caeni TaxID=2984949 RepID=UPI002232C8F3|nr:helix-turn-helix domain-containing protein [Sphingomonas caeni]MCW3848117.1 helix-turn-helix domain-containing protein [Sphingomonas caeni]
MAAKRLNSRLIKLHHSYAIEEISRALGVHKNTVRGWRTRGLLPIDSSRPILFQGRVLREFLERERNAAKRPCPPGHFYCLRCRTPRPPAFGMVDYSARNATSGNLSALCGTCGTLMHRRASLASLPAIMPGIDVQVTQAPSRIGECAEAPSNCDKGRSR